MQFPNLSMPLSRRLGPFIPLLRNENITSLQMEGDSTSGWTASGGGTFTTDGTWVTLSGPTNAARYVTFSSTGSNDFIAYVKIKAPYTSSVYSGISFRTSGNTNRISVLLGYSFPSAAATLGTVSVSAGSTTADLETGRDYSANPVELAFHVDRNRSTVSVYIKRVGSEKWTYVTHLTGVTVTDWARFQLAVNQGTTDISCDYAIICRPAMIAFGDSIPAGHTLFDPDPSVYAGNDDNDSTWMKHALLQRHQRNSLIVNKGVGGNTSAQMVTRVAECTAHSPLLVFLHVSSNDHQASVTQATRTSNIQSLVSTINSAIRASRGSIVLLNGIYANSNYSSYPGHAAYMQDWWANYRDQVVGVVGWVDTMDPLKDSSNVLAAALAQSDGIHPNVAGYQALGAYIGSLEAEA